VNSDSEDEETMERVTSPVVVEAVSDLADVNSDSEDEETMERVTSPVVVEAVSDVTDTNEATGSADNVVNNSPNLVIAEEGDYVEEVVECRAEVPSDPGPFSEDVTMDDFLPRPSRGSVVFLAFSDW
jgi:DNA-directed RNA polymerase beta subunit